MKYYSKVLLAVVASLACLSLFSCKKYHSIYAADWQLVSINEEPVEGNGILTMDEDDNFSWSWNGEVSAKGTYEVNYDTIWFYENNEKDSLTECMEIFRVNNNELILQGVYSKINTTDTIKVAFDRIQF